MSFLIALAGDLWSRIGGYVIGAGALIGTIGAVWFKGRQDGKEIIRREQEQRRMEAITKRKELDDDVARATGADLDARAQRWVRKD